MSTRTVRVDHLEQRLPRDSSRTILRYFNLGSEERIAAVVARVLALDPDEAERVLAQVIQTFKPRHEDLRPRFIDHFERACTPLGLDGSIVGTQRLLIGAYFTMEYAYASAALFNPSMIRAIDQSGTNGQTRFIMSLRAVGEGHISSVVFRTGLLEADGQVQFETLPARTTRLRRVMNRRFRKNSLLTRIVEVGAYTDAVGRIFERLGEEFTEAAILAAIDRCRADAADGGDLDVAAETLTWITESNYQVELPKSRGLSEVVMFPASPNESNGVEDMRLVHFIEDDGSELVYGTYTAYNGSRILPQLIEIRPETRVLETQMLTGRCARNKGIALFPRRINGQFAALGRLDGENLYYMASDNVRFWNEAELLQTPRFPWQLMLIGNCGSPIETSEGWLVLTHGVGAMRRYSIGATLLDLEDPRKLIGQLEEPLLTPHPDDRGGYVPNVVYSCGGMVHHGRLVLPYGICDVESRFAIVDMDELLTALKRG